MPRPPTRQPRPRPVRYARSTFQTVVVPPSMAPRNTLYAESSCVHRPVSPTPSIDAASRSANSGTLSRHVVRAAILLPAPAPGGVIHRTWSRREKVRADRRRARPAPHEHRVDRRFAEARREERGVFDAHVRICAHDPRVAVEPALARRDHHRRHRAFLVARVPSRQRERHIIHRERREGVRPRAPRGRASASRVCQDVGLREHRSPERGRPAGAQVLEMARRTRRREVDERRRRRARRVADAHDRDGSVRERGSAHETLPRERRRGEFCQCALDDGVK